MATPVTLASGRSRFQPPSFALDQGGNLFVANGLDVIQRWNGFAAATQNAGMVAPTVAPVVTTPTGGAATAGDYLVAYRYVDADGNASNLSPTASVTAAANDQFGWTITSAPGTREQGTVELFRTTAGQTIIFYRVGVLNHGTTTFSSDDDSDDTISATTPYAILNADGTTNLNRFTAPPNKAIIAALYDRFFYMGEVIYDEGSVELTNGSDAVTGRGTNWTSAMVGRKFYVLGEATEYEVEAVGSATSITLVENFSGSTGKFYKYAIREERPERNTIYFSRALEPESVPATQYARFDEDNDTIVGAMPLNSYLYALGHRHLYRLSLSTEGPCICLTIQRASERGCASSRCWAAIEGTAYLLDERGVHAFDGNGSEHISSPIQDMWRGKRINFAASKWFFASLDPQREMVRFHVALGGAYLPNAAICYLYRTKHWFIEEYPYKLGAACAAEMAGQPATLLGGQYGKFYVQKGTLDGVVAESVRRNPTAASALQITDTTSGAVPDSVVGATLAIVAGPGKHQARTIVASSGGTMTVDRPFYPIPTTDSEYQIGGIPWSVRLGTHAYVPDAKGQDVDREWQLVTKPTPRAATIDVRRYVDQAETPVNNVIESTPSQPYGVTTIKDDPDTVANIQATRNSGYRQFRFDSKLQHREQVGRYVSLELRGVQGPDEVAIHEISVEGVE